ncbi:MAG: prepilin-type N-terminal cleavage/methylation domain-containing protein [Planctomycetota bacterium]|jgi:prepilin-type N-terminal cleavage/methylation domain-containing protein
MRRTRLAPSRKLLESRELNTSNPSGFTLIELVVTIVIMTLLVGIAVPAIGSLQDDAKVAKILATSEAAKSACQRHYVDTSLYGTENSRAQNAAGHTLSEKQTTKGWKGPYMDRPLSAGDNPFGGDIMLYNTFAGGTHKLFGNQFRLTGPTSPRHQGKGNFIAFDGIPQSVAQSVDTALDDGIAGNWKRFGRVQWRNTNGGSLMIYLLDNN